MPYPKRTKVCCFTIHFILSICDVSLDLVPPPIADSPTNPFLTLNASGTQRVGRGGVGNLAPTGIVAGADSESEGELFPNPSPAGTSSSRATATPRSRGTPRSGRHSIVNRARTASTANARATPKKKKSARDVWTFFKDTSKGRFCLFCEYVLIQCRTASIYTIC